MPLEHEDLKLKVSVTTSIICVVIDEVVYYYKNNKKNFNSHDCQVLCAWILFFYGILQILNKSFHLHPKGSSSSCTCGSFNHVLSWRICFHWTMDFILCKAYISVWFSYKRITLYVKGAACVLFSNRWFFQIISIIDSKILFLSLLKIML